jgi:hypothetical protein
MPEESVLVSISIQMLKKESRSASLSDIRRIARKESATPRTFHFPIFSLKKKSPKSVTKTLLDKSTSKFITIKLSD